MKVNFSRKFSKLYSKVELKVKVVFQARLELFQQEPLNPLLNNHPLKGRLSGYRSINITGDWRALYSESVGKDSELVVTFEVLGTHSQLYK